MDESKKIEILVDKDSDNHQVKNTLEFSIDNYEGPLDLLLDLAKTQKVDLMQISIVQLVDQYIAYVDKIKKNLEIAADFLVMASWLAYLKSRLLLPEDNVKARNNKNKNKHSGVIGILNLIKDLRKHNFDKIFIFNSSLRFNLIARFSKIPKIYQYPLFSKTNQHIIDTPKKFLRDKLNINGVKNLGYLNQKKLSILQSRSKYSLCSGENIYSLFVLECITNHVKILINKLE